MTPDPATVPNTAATDPLQPALPATPGQTLAWSGLHGTATALALVHAARNHDGPVLVVTADAREAERIEQELAFFSAGEDLPIRHLPDWETLPWDVFSPHQDIISARLETLYRLPGMQRGLVVVPAGTLIQRLPPANYVRGGSLVLAAGEQLNPEAMAARLEQAGYQRVPQVMEHGDFAVRGSLIDLFPMGSEVPYRIDLFDDEIESIRTFDPGTQLTRERVKQVRLLPAREFPLDEDGIREFRRRYRAALPGDPSRSLIYQDVSAGLAPGGIEYYLPLFFDELHTLFDYLPASTMVASLPGADEGVEAAWNQIEQRHDQRGHDPERPLLSPGAVFIPVDELHRQAGELARVAIHPAADDSEGNSAPPPQLLVNPRAGEPAAALKRFLDEFRGRVLFAAESAGRREALIDQLQALGHRPREVSGWREFADGSDHPAITLSPLEQGLLLREPAMAVISEPQLLGDRVRQERRRQRRARDPEAIIRDLGDLNPGAPVVHEEHGVGRYLGLQKLDVGENQTEFLTLEYANGDKLYVPVAALHRISRYTGSAPEQAPLHRLGSGQWEKARKRAARRIHDAAAELLEIHARRAARQGHAFTITEADYHAFADAFPFEETPDQQTAIEAVLKDMRAPQPMDRVVCGDVGFGKTEVAMRAAFVAVSNGFQVAILVPTTLLAQQHLQNFRDRFADWPVRVEALSRLRSRGEQEQTLAGVRDGAVDIVIGTHKLLGKDINFKRLGLVVVDEEHRFGVRHKERLKQLRAEVDLLTLTATPIPRTLNMSLAGLRDLSIIATPPTERLTVKTFVGEWNNALIQEACLREIKRGGQVYFLHNKVESIERTAAEVEKLVPEARVRIAHGQMREKDLEQVMLDFYHRRFNILVCTTIIESGIDVPTANTIIINRADHLGLAQLHQLRGRVGRSHHRAYAYLLAPPRKALPADAVKRLEAMEALEDLGAGFTLATHDLEIRGAGELLGEEQTGQIQQIGFSLYNELLERAVTALRKGEVPDLESDAGHATEVELRVPALLPEDYVPDVHMRLVLYKRIASAPDATALRELQVELIDRFGLLPDPVRNLFRVTHLRLRAAALGIRKLELGDAGGRIIFTEKPAVDPALIIQLIQTRPGTFSLDGQDTLRLKQPMESDEARLDAAEALLEQLASPA